MIKTMKDKIEETIENYPREYKEGLTQQEVDNIKSQFDVNEEMFDYAMMGNTCMVKNGEVLTYPWDLILGIKCGVENRKPTIGEWD